MPEPRRWRPIALAALAGVALSALLAAGGAWAAAGGWLAQPAFALAAAWWAGRRPPKGWTADLAALAAAWFAGLALVALLVAWPLAALRQGGSLGAMIGLSLGAGLALVALWRSWPLWHGLEREGGPLARHWQAISSQDPSAWRGLVAALLVALPLAAIVLAAWPGLLPPAGRGGLAAALALLGLPLHHALQRLAPAAALALPVFDLDGSADHEDDDAEAADPDAASPAERDAALNAAARAGRVDRALALLDAGADPHALPPADARDQRSLPVLAAVLPDLRLLRALIAHGVDVNAAHGGLTRCWPRPATAGTGGPRR